MTFEINSVVYLYETTDVWMKFYEAFGLCRGCQRCTIFVIRNSDFHSARAFDSEHKIIQFPKPLNPLYFEVIDFVGLKHNAQHTPPEHLPESISNVFTEGATCLAVGCYNAAATMFRLCIDLATRPLLPDPGECGDAGPNARQRRDLGLRLPWLFSNGRLEIDLQELATCIREDGNDGAHHGTLDKADAEDIHDFTFDLLERLYTRPNRLKLNKQKRDARRANLPA